MKLTDTQIVIIDTIAGMERASGEFITEATLQGYSEYELYKAREAFDIAYLWLTRAVTKPTLTQEESDVHPQLELEFHE